MSLNDPIDEDASPCREPALRQRLCPAPGCYFILANRRNVRQESPKACRRMIRIALPENYAANGHARKAPSGRRRRLRQLSLRRPRQPGRSRSGDSPGPRNLFRHTGATNRRQLKQGRRRVLAMEWSETDCRRQPAGWTRRRSSIRRPAEGQCQLRMGAAFHSAPRPADCLRDSAILQREALPQVVSEAKDNMA